MKVMEEELALNLYDLMIRDCCFPLYLIQVEDVAKLIRSVSQYYVKMALEQGVDIGDIDQNYVPLMLFKEVLGEH